MRRHGSILAAALLSGCGSEVSLTNASTEEVAAAVGEKAGEKFIDPGQWEQKATLVSIDAPGMPPEAKAMLSRAAGQSQVHNVCLSPEQARSPREDFFTGADKNCRYSHFRWGRGKIDMKLDCEHPRATQTMTLNGTYRPDSYEMAMTATNVGATADEQFTMQMRVDARRVGACTPGAGGTDAAP